MLYMFRTILVHHQQHLVHAVTICLVVVWLFVHLVGLYKHYKTMRGAYSVKFLY
jgi:hypothetical protein